MSGTREPPDRRHAGGPRLEQGSPDALVEGVDLPATTRIGHGRAPDRILRLAMILAATAVALALAKPWDWGAPAALPGPEGPATPGPVETLAAAEAGPRARPWTDLDARVSCFSNRLWMVVVDEVDDGGRTLARSWIRLDPVPATGPTEPTIVRAHAYAEAVPRIGFCAPTAGATGRPGGRLEVSAWRLEQGAELDAAAVPIDPALVAGGTIADGGALFGPPAGTPSGRAAGAHPDGPGPGGADPEAAWSTDGDAPWRPAGWSTGPTPAGGGWQPGTYVFRVDVVGVGAGGHAEAWLAVELRGPWRGPDGTTPGSGAPGLTPGAEPALDPAQPTPEP